MNLEIVAEGLFFPEGPIAMADGSVILVEIRRGTVSRVWNGKIEVIGVETGKSVKFRSVAPSRPKR